MFAPATELEGQSFERGSSVGHDDYGRSPLAREGDLIDTAMLDERIAGGFAIARHVLMTPSGKPGSWASSPIQSAVNRIYSAGLSTIMHPAASAGAHFQATISIGKFQGMIWPTTPIGSRIVEQKWSPRMGRVWPVSLSAQPA